ncbi:hypothetical protein DXD54_08220 [Clostridium sp. TM06-18]|nr:hypothetical protein [Clostridium sp. TM06-18]RHU37165.1 hypothetical protein DXD54_08220 [Clostridium sp. TM06-18]
MNFVNGCFVIGMAILLFLAVLPEVMTALTKEVYIKEVCKKNKYHPSLAVVASLFTAGRVFLSSTTVAQADSFMACMMMAVSIASGLIYLFFIVPVCAHESEKCREAIKDICETKEQSREPVKEG